MTGLPESEPGSARFRIQTREQLFYTLIEAAEIEHNPMYCYLYAVFSFKVAEADGLTAGQAEMVARWCRAIIFVAVEEMAHLALVANLSTAVDAPPHLGRPNFPIPRGYHPAGVQVKLAPFSPDTLQHFIYFERPAGSEEPDGAGFPSAEAYELTPHPEASSVEEVQGRELLLRFDTRRCIHSRAHVTTAPETFLANVKGDWLFSDKTATAKLAEVAHACPSGAITYRRDDGGPEEEAPAVNLATIRENGPYAVRTDMRLEGGVAVYRATPCRCGASKRKPYCDGSHSEIGFTATGEPASETAGALTVRQGVLDVRPLVNGPLQVEWPLEIISRTGRVVSRASSALLCRCGGSAKKPLYDGTHSQIGFKS